MYDVVGLEIPDLIVGLEIPDFRTVSYYTPFSTDPHYCKKWDDAFNVNNKVLHEICNEAWPAYLAPITKLDHARERKQHIMECDINPFVNPLVCQSCQIQLGPCLQL